MRNEKKNYKIVIGFIIGIILSATGVYAVTYYGEGTDLTYNNTSSGLKATNIQEALDELYEEANDPCPGYYCEKYKTTLSLGDYVSYTPTSTSYTTDTSKTGYTSTQTINPSELNLWRILKINDDGSVDLISEYTSSVDIYFKGKTGYLNFVGYLNLLAKQYENSNYTKGSRYFGYNGQTEYITDDSKFTNPAPWTSSTGSSTVESQGGGDTLYTDDYNQLNTALGTRVAYKVGTSIATTYWVASRYYTYNSATNYYWRGRNVNSSGSLTVSNLYYYYSSSFREYGYSSALRPIVTLKSGLSYGEGIGTANAPIKILS